MTRYIRLWDQARVVGELLRFCLDVSLLLHSSEDDVHGSSLEATATFGHQLKPVHAVLLG